MISTKVQPVPDISIIVPVYNGEKSIGQCMASVLASNVSPGTLEVICVDNGSTDQTLSILHSFGPAIHVLHAKNRGAGAARNTGILAARGTYLAFTDADCTVHPDWVTQMVQPLRIGDADAVGGRILARPCAGPVERFGELIHDHQRAIALDSPPYIIGMSLAARRDLLISLNGIDERWLRMQDIELSYRLIDVGCRLRYCHHAVIYHHNRDTLYTLAREGYIHGKYRSAFLAVYKDRFEELIRKAAIASVPVKKYPGPATRLAGWQIFLFRTLFQVAGRIGETEGRLFPPVTIAAKRDSSQ